MEKKKVLITGGAGYLGSVLTGHLLNEGYKVTCLDNLMYRQNSLVNFAGNKNFEFIYGDASNENLLKETLPSFDVIFPLAAKVGITSCKMHPEMAKQINYDAIVKLNNIRSKDQILIYPNTNSGYGAQSGDYFCTEETPLEPISLYGQTKVKAEKYLLENEKDAITLRLATVFGISPRMRTDLLLNKFVLRGLSDGYLVLYEAKFKRNHIHIKDVARCFEHCIKNFDSMKNEPYNLGLETANLSKLELAEKIKSYIPNLEIICNEIREDPDKRNYLVSNKKIMSTGFNPLFSLDDGIEELIKSYKIILRNDPMQNT